MKIEMWCPVPVLVNQLPDSVADIISDKVYVWSTHESNCLAESPEENLTTTYHISSNFIELCNLTELYDAIIESSVQFTANMGIKLPKNFKIDSWVNFFTRNQTEQEHTHYGNFLSGCYYVNAPEGSGLFCFPDPVRERQMWRGVFMKEKEYENILNVNSSSYKPERGKLLLFQSWMPHSVLKNNSDEPRISIAFNVNPIY